MTDVEILYPNQKGPVAERLRDALIQAGYEVRTRDAGGDRASPASEDATALLIIWDRSSIWNPGMQDTARFARKRGRALDVSADGITPIGLSDEGRLVQLSGWRGDPHHPGWKKILSELNRLCEQGRRARPTRVAATSANPDAPVRSRTASEGVVRPIIARDKFLPLAGLGALLAMSLLGALLIFGRPVLPRQPEPRSSIASAVTEPRAHLPVVVAANEYPKQKARAPLSKSAGREGDSALPSNRSNANTVLEVGPVGQASAEAGVPEADQVATTRSNKIPSSNCLSGRQATRGCTEVGPARARKAERARAARSNHRHQEAARPSVRYTPYAGTMRLFCQRSGRRLPQCGLFRREFGGSGRSRHPRR
jgi:hypothetical protein